MTTSLFHPCLEKRAAFFKVAEHVYGIAYTAGEVRLVDARTFNIGEMIRQNRALRADGFAVDLREACS